VKNNLLSFEVRRGIGTYSTPAEIGEGLVALHRSKRPIVKPDGILYTVDGQPVKFDV
jgi:hypothetical protein